MNPSPDTWISGVQALGVAAVAIRLIWGAATKDDLSRVTEDIREVRKSIHDHVSNHPQGSAASSQQMDEATIRAAVEGALNARRPPADSS